MKKILYGVMAATMIFATSCENELEVGAAGEESVVSFTIATPDMGSRADYSDGTTATVLQYAVYEGETELTDLTKSVEKGNAETINGSTTVNLKLTTGNTYSVVFWAAAPNAPYTVDFGAKTMTVNYANATSNDENRDAFYAKETFTVTGAQTETITLKRPFAQLNIGTNDYAASTSAGYTPTQSAVTVKNLKNTLNFFDGTVTGDEEARVFASAAIPAGQEFPVAGYEYLAMNYVLVGVDKTVVDVEFTYTDGTDAKTRTVGSVPVQRNYRTNIYGQLLTSDVDVNVEIEPDYQGSHVAEALFLAAAVGGEVTLTEDVVLTAPLEVQANMVINLNGKTITGTMPKSIGAVIKVTEGKTMKLIGGKVESTAANGGSAIENYGKLIVEGTEVVGASIRENGGWPSYPINNYGDMTLKNVVITGYQGAIACTAAGTTILENCTINKEYLNTSSHVFYITHAEANVIVNSGSYTHKGMDGSLAYVIAGTITVNGGTFAANGGGYGMAPLSNGKVVINGGSFTSMPINWGGSITLKGGSFAKKPNDAWIAEGYKAVEKDGKFYVVAEDVDVASTAAEFTAALAAGNDVVLIKDININKIDLTSGTNDVVIDAQGHTITTANAYGVEVTAGKNVTLKNAVVKMTVEGNYITYAAGFKISNGDYTGKTITLDNCTIKMINPDWAYAINMPASVKNLNLNINKCTLEGAIALQCWGDNNVINVTESNLICNYTTNALYTSYCVALQGDGSYNSENNKLNISDSHLSYSGIDNFNSVIYSVYDAGLNNTISVSNCTYEGVKEEVTKK